MLYTTGTTGRPKGVMLTHGNLRFSGRASARVRGMGPGDVICGALPVTHVFGLASMLTAAVTSGAALRLLPRFDPARVLAVLDGDETGEGATHFPAVPQMHAAVMRHARGAGRERLDGSLRYASSGAAPLDPAWKRDAEAFYGVALQNGYGLTESTAGVATTRNALGDPDTSVGPPLDGVEVRDRRGGAGWRRGLRRDPDARPPRHARLLARARGDGGRAAVTAGSGRATSGGSTARAGSTSPGGARSSSSAGASTSIRPRSRPRSTTTRRSRSAPWWGASREGGDEEVVAFVQLARPASEAELAAWARERLAGYKRPSRIVTADALPCAPTGKVLKHELLGAFADRL